MSPEQASTKEATEDLIDRRAYTFFGLWLWFLALQHVSHELHRTAKWCALAAMVAIVAAEVWTFRELIRLRRSLGLPWHGRLKGWTTKRHTLSIQERIRGRTYSVWIVMILCAQLSLFVRKFGGAVWVLGPAFGLAGLQIWQCIDILRLRRAAGLPWHGRKAKR